MDDKLAKRIETMLKKSEIILKVGNKTKPLRVKHVYCMYDSEGFPREYFCGECFCSVERNFKYCPYCGKILYW